MDGDVITADVVVIAMGPWSSVASQWLPGFPHVEGDKVIYTRSFLTLPAFCIFVAGCQPLRTRLT